MTESKSPSVLKHGAFSEILILPGEDPQEFAKLKDGLFAEYKPSGDSEERLMGSIAKALWQERRLDLYEHVQYLRARKSGDNGRGPDLMQASLDAYSRAAGLPEFPPPEEPTTSVEKSDEDALLELGNLVTVDHLAKELDVETKLQAKIDRLFKRFFQTKAMKQMVGLADSQAPSLVGPAPMLELTATDPIKSSVE